jgi:RNA polymerase sigma-70 factor (ECF subfamily)
VKDLLQDLFAKLAEGRAGWRDDSAERAYLMQMVRRGAIDRTRREKVRREHAGPGEVFERCEDPDREAFREQLEGALAELPIEQREVVVLKLWEERTFEEIAEICGIPANTAASRYRYGLDKLRTMLRPVYEEL